MKKLTCVVPGCDSGDCPTDNLNFHQIPKEADVRKKWLKAINRTEAEINKKSRVCSKHFKTQDYAITKINYTMGGKTAPSSSKNTCEFKALKTEAVPNVLLPQKSTFKIKISKKDNAKQIKVEEVKVKEEKIDRPEKLEKMKMPKRPAPPDSPPPRSRTQSRRAASKEALKQMQLLLDDENDTVEIPDDVIPIDSSTHIPPPPKKKYKLSHRKSSDGTNKPAIVESTYFTVDREAEVLKTITNRDAENTLELDCWIEPLEEVQINRGKKIEDEEKELQAKLDSLISQCNAKVIHKGQLDTVIEVAEQVQSAIQGAQAPPTSLIINNNLGGQQSYQLVMDPRMGLVVGSVNPSTTTTQPVAGKVYQGKVQVAQNLQQTPTTSSTQNTPRVVTRTRGRGSTNKITPSPPVVTPTRSSKVAGNQNSPAVTHPTRAQAVPPSRAQIQAAPLSRTQAPATTLTRAKIPAVAKKQVTIVQTNAPNTRGRGPSPNTFTTQVRLSETNVDGGLTTGTAQSKKVVVDLTSDDGKSSAPDSREISFNKLQGKTYPSLVVVARPHLRVDDLSSDRPKLDAKVKSVLMYPPTKFTEWLIQQGLIRSEQKCTIHTNTQLKLGMYDDVVKFPYSGGYVWISECCLQKFVSVFSGSLFEGSPHPPMVILKLLYHWACQTNIQNVTQWVKVDNLYVKGMFTWLRSACTVALQTHIRQIGGPGIKVEVGVISLGTTSQDGNQRQVKVEVLGVLESESKLIRLRAVEPQVDGDRNYKKRFSKILEPLIQWVHPQSVLVADLTVDKQTLISMGFSNVAHYSSTQYGNNKQIMDYLRRIVPRMFQNTLSLLSRQIIQQFLDELVWREWFGTTSVQAFDNIVEHLSEQTKFDSGMSLIVRLNKVAQNPFKSWNMNLGNPSKPLENSNKKSRNARKPDPPKSTQQAPIEMNRPPKSTSPDVPEQMVPLENYYYGTIDTYSKTPKITLNMKCPFCKSVFDNNIQLMSHLFKHAHNVSMDAQLCRYCLTSVATANDLLKHIATSHPAETKFDNGFCCLICETQYMNPFVLGKHMSKEHCPSELPYQCGTCGYRCSNHKQAIDHFYRTHDNGPTIQCPFCLKSTTVFSSSRNIVQNMNYFIQHLQKHQRKQFARRCGKCNLWFVQKDVIKEHQNKMHISQRGKTGLVPWNAPRNGVMVPKSKMDKYPGDAEVINFAVLTFDLGKGLMCKECNTPMDTPKHFPSFESCQNPNCQYSTCCTNAMQEHNAKCSKTNNPIAEETLPFEMFCICGFSSLDGNQLARHLAICERKSSYPSRSEAHSAIVTHSMLDVLGLVRKPEETTKGESSRSEYSRPKPRTEKRKRQKQEEDELNALEEAAKMNKEDDVVMMEELEDEIIDRNKNDEIDAIAVDDHKEFDSENKSEEMEEDGEEKENPIQDVEMSETIENPEEIGKIEEKTEGIDETADKIEKAAEETDKTVETTDKIDETTEETDKIDETAEETDKTAETTDKIDETAEETDKIDETAEETDKIDETAEKTGKMDETTDKMDERTDKIDQTAEYIDKTDETTDEIVENVLDTDTEDKDLAGTSPVPESIEDDLDKDEDVNESLKNDSKDDNVAQNEEIASNVEENIKDNDDDKEETEPIDDASKNELGEEEEEEDKFDDKEENSQPPIEDMADSLKDMDKEESVDKESNDCIQDEDKHFTEDIEDNKESEEDKEMPQDKEDEIEREETDDNQEKVECSEETDHKENETMDDVHKEDDEKIEGLQDVEDKEDEVEDKEDEDSQEQVEEKESEIIQEEVEDKPEIKEAIDEEGSQDLQSEEDVQENKERIEGEASEEFQPEESEDSQAIKEETSQDFQREEVGSNEDIRREEDPSEKFERKEDEIRQEDNEKSDQLLEEEKELDEAEEKVLEAEEIETEPAQRESDRVKEDLDELMVSPVETLSHDLQNHVSEKEPTITSDDIQNLLSDVVGESEEAMDTDSGNKQIDAVASEMMEISDGSGDAPTPMDTD